MKWCTLPLSSRRTSVDSYWQIFKAVEQKELLRITEVGVVETYHDQETRGLHWLRLLVLGRAAARQGGWAVESSQIMPHLGSLESALSPNFSPCLLAPLSFLTGQYVRNILSALLLLCQNVT